MTAELRPIPGFPGYSITDDGRVWSSKSGRFLKATPDGTGRLHVGLHRNGKQYTRKVHILVAEAFYGKRPEGMVTRHLNGDHLDNRAANLSWGTQAENIADAVAHGTHNMASKTQCPQGHPYSGENLHVRPSTGDRLCRTCQRARYAARMAAA